MKMVMVGCSHHTAAVEFRERLAFSADQVAIALDGFRRRFPDAEAVLLSTCNRVELYAARASDKVTELEQSDLIDFLAETRGLGSDELMNGLIYRSGAEAVEHLFTVAASLDSMVVGESQILGQVKEAYEAACRLGATGPLTHAIFQGASHVAKRVSRETQIHQRRVSVPSVAIGEVAAEFFERLDGKRVVVLGAGEMADEALRYLRQQGADQIRILNRTLSRAESLARAYESQAVPWEQLDEELVRADLVVSTTSAPQPIMPGSRFQEIHARRRDRMLLVLDLAVPRDFEASVGEFAGVFLYGVDDLQAACQRNRHLREREWPKAQRIIAEETQKLIGELHFKATGPVIQRLREQADTIKAEEFKRLLAKLEKHQLPEAAVEEFRRTLDRVVNKLLHPPLASLRDDAVGGDGTSLLEALKRLFKL